MTIETLNAIKSEAVAMNLRFDSMVDSVVAAEGVIIPIEVDNALDSISISLSTIFTWVNQEIEDGGNTEEIGVMQAFLAELKAVFDKYAAVIEYVSSGYGEDMGENYGGASFYRLTATDPVNGNVETKDIVSATLSSEQLI